MAKYRFSDENLNFIEKSRIPFAVYQYVGKRVVTVALSAGFCELFGYGDLLPAYAEMDRNMYADTHPDDVARISEAAHLFATRGGRYDVIYRTKDKKSGAYRLIHAIGEHVWVNSKVRLAYIWYTDEGEYQEKARGSGLNPSLSRALRREQMLKESFYDSLTGLPSVNYFMELAEAAQNMMLARDEHPVLLYADLCGMKFYNQRYGYADGDRLLQAFARLLMRHFGADSCGRIGQDHFVVCTERTGVEENLERLFRECRELNDGRSTAVRVGICLDWPQGTPVGTACDCAKIACDTLRGSYNSAYARYNETLLDDAERREYIIENLDRALAEGWIRVFYQPIVRAVNGRVCDEEALARWNDPKKGFLSPAQFIPILEEAGLSYKLDLHVVEQVLEKLVTQREKGLYLVPQSVNLSRADFDACDMVEEIRRRVDDAGFERNLLNIEITETVIGSDFKFMKEQVERFDELGFPVWMDDFGSGYSSLDLLQSIRFRLIKFDMRFMQSFNEGDNGKIILTELTRMATALGFETVCEGVETEEQVRFLQEIGCTKLQGFFYCRPIPLETILERYEKQIQIGFENPEESAYYDTLGKVNLYDLGAIANEDSDSFHNYFDTIPMAIVEITGEHVRYTRTNRAYRDFMGRKYGLLLTDEQTPDGGTADAAEADFRSRLLQCCRDGGRAFLDEKLPDNTSVHAFIRKLAVNPVTGTVAVGIAVLSIMENNDGTSYEEIAHALAADYFNLFYVDLETEEFIEYTSAVGEENLVTERRGKDFFAKSREDAMKYLYEEDREGFVAEFNKENVVHVLDVQGTFTTSYRLMQGGVPTYVNMKVRRIGRDGRHVVVGVSNIDAQMREQKALDQIRQHQKAYSRMTALSGDFICIYTVDPKTWRYVEFSATEDYSGLGLAREGEDFFRRSQENAEQVIAPECLPEYRRVFTEENVMRDIRETGFFRMSYELLIGGVPRKVGLRATLVQESDGEKLIMGVKYIDEH